MGGEYHVDRRMAPACGKDVEIRRLRPRGEAGKIFRSVKRSHQPAQPVGPREQAFAFEFGHQDGNLIKRQLAAFQPARQF